MSRLAQVREEAIALQREIGKKFRANPELNFSDQEIEEIRTKNARLEVLTAEAERLAKAEGHSGAMRDGQPVRGPIFPGGSSPGLKVGRRSVLADAWGEAVVKANSREVGFKDLLPSGSVTVTVPLQRVPVAFPQRPRFLRDLIPQTPAPTGHFAYFQQTTRTNNAAPVEHGEKKPTSVYGLERVEDRVRTIAHLSEPIPRQDLSDAPMLEQFVRDEMGYGLEVALDAQILSGDGGEGDPNFRGILNTPGIQTQTVGADPLALARSALTKLQIAELEPDQYVFSPTDWESVEVEAREQYAANPRMSPVDALTRSLFGVPVFVTTGIPDGTGLLGAFGSSAELHMREDARIDWSEGVFDPDFGESGATDFERNLIRFRAEMRAGLAVLRPVGFVEIVLNAGEGEGE